MKKINFKKNRIIYDIVLLLKEFENDLLFTFIVNILLNIIQKYLFSF